MTEKYGSSKNMSAEEKEEKKMYADMDLRTLVEAEEIKRDKERLRAAKKCAREKMKSMKEITA